MLDIDFEYENDLDGLGVGLHAVSELEGQVSEVTGILKKLKSLGFALADIAIISCKGSQSSVFSALDKIGKYRLKRFTGEYDSSGNQVYTEGDILFDSIFRFKGNQSPAVILVDIDKTESLSDRDRSVLFCGMTRATVRLDIISAA
jgi:superfamily I DNA and RNA helicase